MEKMLEESGEKANRLKELEQLKKQKLTILNKID